MKKRFIYIVSIIVLGFYSCDLTEEPYGFYSDDNFYKTVEDADAALLYAYRAFNYLGYNRGMIDIGDLSTEIMSVKAGEGNGVQELDQWKSTKSNGTLSDFFQYCYIAINRANGVIENVVDQDFNQADKERILGEAYTIRAWSYFSLVRVFGKVPMQKQLVSTEAQTTPALAKDLDEVYNFILEDLNTAESFLSMDRKVGHFDKVASWAILAKVYLNIASGKDNNAAGYRDMVVDANEMYTQSAKWSAKVLNEQAEFSLDTSIGNIYDVEKADGPEHIWLISMDRTGDNTEEFGSFMLMWMPWGPGASYYVKNAKGVMEPTQNGWEVYHIETAFRDSFGSTDKRETDLIGNEIFDVDGNSIGSVADGNIIAPFSTKYLDPKFNGNRTSTRPLMIRFSDIALTYAEAVGPTADGEMWLNKIRSRAGIDPVTTGMSITDFRKTVLQERKWELAFEGHHLFDLRRTATVLSNISEAQSSGLTEDEAAFYPIPLRELDLNPNAK
ncbi:RagB/SusD family nutrient uptake outer membrane protein [Polaribacter sp. Q13]|uniref:RagB/SusD family nutrient uptake outer membrane protein n=1 Tax=Polaribacter sp. Q13 TaxID=2806551 RepID=UPI00193B248C|nr:RagB/SusD family nutrient uptake outer membrane protein [Polaribacter sp. Q13]QVY66156.1 RagB/SusD family nutrient uptake outer membrane protein [Polaribacter sp. Q13]